MSKPPDMSGVSWQEEYRHLLHSSVPGTRRPADERIKALGRRLVEQNISPATVAAFHADLLTESTSGPATDHHSAAAHLHDFLVYVLAAYDQAASRPQQPPQTAHAVSETQDEQRYRELFNSVPIGLYRTTPSGQIIDANPALAQLFGFPNPESLTSCNVADLYLHPAERRERLSELERDGVVHEALIQARRRDGRTIWLRDCARAILGSDGRVQYYEGSLADVTAHHDSAHQRAAHNEQLERLVAERTNELSRTNQRLRSELAERTRVEDALRASEQRIQAVLSSLHETAVVLYSPDGVIEGAWAPDDFARRCGLIPQKVVGCSLHDVLPPGVRERRMAQLREIIATGRGQRDEYDFTGPDDVRHYETNLSPVRSVGTNEITGVVAFVRDLTDRSLMEAALRESEERFRQVAESIAEGFWLYDLAQEKLVYVSPVVAEIWQTPLSVFQEDPLWWLQHVHPADRANMEAVIQRELDGQETEAEYRVTRPDGTERWLRSRSFPVHDTAGRTARIAGFIEDVTQRKRAEEALRTERDFITDIFTRTPAIICGINADGELTFCNPAAETAIGYPAEELKQGNVWQKCYPGEQFAQVERLLDRLQQGDVRDYEMTATARSGAHCTVSWSTVTHRNAVGQVKEVIGFGVDVTQRERTESLLRIQRDLAVAQSSTSNLKEAAEQVLAHAARIEGIDCGGVYIVDQHTGALHAVAYRGFSEMFARAAAQYDADSLNARIVAAGAIVYRAAADPSPLEEYRRAEGLRAFAAVPIKHEQRVIACLNLGSHTHDEIPDITREGIEAIALRLGGVIARIQAEAGRRESEEKFRTLAETSTAAILIAQGDRLRYVNPALARMLSYDPSEMIDRPFRDFVQRDMQALVEERSVARQSGAQVPARYELHARARDGSTRILDFSATTLPYEGAPAVLGTALDITDRKRAEDALRSSEERYRLLADNAMDMISRVSVDGRILYVSPACRSMLQYEPEELIGTDIYDLFHADDLAGIRDGHERVLAAPVSHLFLNRVRRKDGQHIWCDTTAAARRDPTTGEFVEIIAVSRDVTDRKRAEEAAQQHREHLAHVNRVSTMGEMASGLAHELAQPLSAILYYARGCTARLESGTWGTGEAMSAMQRIATQSERAGEFIRRLKAFVRKAPPARAATDVNEIIRDAVSFATALVRQRQVAIELDLQPDLPPVVVDPIQIEQVILNLLRNGVEAMDTIPPAQRSLRVSSYANDQQKIHVAVADRGPGLPADVRRQMFDAFFTTKVAGTGLGLSISRSIIEAHDGELWVRDDIEEGAEIGFSLSTAEGAPHDATA